ncbi:MAG TPA: glycosyltransferase family 39 protein [Terriglobales bacterium]|nr:glycosyltransferase family 39 protein [Terriglobales bacterium]
MRSTSGWRAALLLAAVFAVLALTHAPLLRLPYFWDEAGYFVPAARDLLLTGSLIPHSTLPNSHPPLVMAYLALCWKLAGFSPPITRLAMLLVAAFALLGIFRLAVQVANREVAIAATMCTALYPVFFAQSSLAHLDVAAAALTLWGLDAYLRGQTWQTAVWFSLAAIAKETAILAPLALLLWEMACPLLKQEKLCVFPRRSRRRGVALLLPMLPLGLWFAYCYWRTGHPVGSADFVRYNLLDTLDPLRIVIAGAQRVWQALGYMNLVLLTAAAALAMWFPPLQDEAGERPRIASGQQAALAAVIVVYILALSVVGGAVLARYMLPVVPLVIVICVSTVWRRISSWRAVVAIVCLGFALGLFINPPWGFAPEDNLAYRDYIRLHQAADQLISEKYGNARVLTAWPGSDELTEPYLGYVQRRMRVLSIDDFSLPHMMAVTDSRAQFDVAFLFSTKYEPPRRLLGDWPPWERTKARFFGYHRDVPPEVAAHMLEGEIVFEKHLGGQWVAVVDLQKPEMARAGNILASTRTAAIDDCRLKVDECKCPPRLGVDENRQMSARPVLSFP